MAYLANPTKTKEIIDRFEFSFKKKFGQNFLIDENIVRNIINGSKITKEDSVLEIGPGIGTMTQMLCEEAKNVVTVEIDNNLIPVLETTLEDYSNVHIINDDILKCNIEALSDEYTGGAGFKVVANLPYYITTPIIMGLLEENSRIESTGKGSVINSITIMIQKEVADRIKAGPNTKDYGALSLAVQYYTRPSLLMNVPATCFMPRPNVGSAVIDLEIKKDNNLKAEDEKNMFKIIRGAFAQRRKTFVNSVNASLGIPKDEIAEALGKIGKNETVRGEALSLEDYIELSKIMP